MNKTFMIAGEPGKPAILEDHAEISYDQLKAKISGYVKLLEDLKPDSKVCIFSENRPEWIYALYAAWQKEGVVVPVDYLASPDDLQYIIEDSTPEIIFCSDQTLETLEQIPGSVKEGCTIIKFEDCTNSEATGTDKLSEISDPDRMALIMYTSGTTGQPKGVMLSFRNLIFNIHAVSSKIKILEKQDRIFMLLPVHHVLPLVGTLILPLFLGSTIVMAPSMIPEEFLATIQKFSPTIIIGVPRLFESMHVKIIGKIKSNILTRGLFGLARLIGSKSFSHTIFKKVHQLFGGSIKYMVSGGARLEPEIFEDFKTMGFEILEGYGLTETAPMISFNHPGNSKSGTPGKPVPGIQVKIEEDEIAVKGENVMIGYLNKPEETQEVLKDGWFYTGDLGYVDDNDFLHITGRKKEIIVLPNGKNINPLEIENKIYALSNGVKEVGVFYHEKVLQALILPEPELIKKYSGDELYIFFKQNIFDKLNHFVSPHKKIMKFHISAEELPKTRLGKIKRYILPDILVIREKKKNDIKEPELEEYRLLKNFIKSDFGKVISPGDHLELDLAIDSLERVSLSAYISSTFGLEVKEEEFTGFDSVTQLAYYLHENKTKTKEEKIDWSDILNKTKSVRVPSRWLTLHFFTGLTVFLFRILYRVKTHGKKNLPNGPFILAPNHQSFLDAFLVISQIPRKHRNKVYSYATVKYFKKNLWRKFATRNNIIIMDIQKDLKLSMQKLANVLKEGKNILIFPEGKRSLNGELLDFKHTFAILSRELKIPVVPVALKGTFEAYPPGKSTPRFFRRLEVRFMPAITPDVRSYAELSDNVYHSIKTAF